MVPKQWYCESLDKFRSVVSSARGDKTYIVLLDEENHKYGDERKKDWSCTCPSYEHHCGPYRKKRYCKHIEKVKAEIYCGWHQEGSEDTPDYGEHGMRHCPRCGREARLQ